MKYGSLFSGIGGGDLGLDLAGMSCAYQVEIDQFASKILAKHWPKVPRHGDITKLKSSALPSTDVIIGGFPCQDISHANTTGGRKGLQGTKSGLWTEYARIVRDKRPRWVIVENVANTSLWLPQVRGDLWRLGYPSVSIRLDTARFGAKHSRKRVFVVANSDSNGQPLQSFYGQMASLSEVPGGCWNRWSTPPTHLGSALRVPGRMDRLRGLGNSIAPGMTALIGCAIVAAEE